MTCERDYIDPKTSMLKSSKRKPANNGGLRHGPHNTIRHGTREAWAHLRPARDGEARRLTLPERERPVLVPPVPHVVQGHHEDRQEVGEYLKLTTSQCVSDSN